MEQKQAEFDLNAVISFLKKNWNWILLLLILLFALKLRVYHLDYPVIGYHNWKEVHYLSEARNFAREGFFKHGFFVPEFDYPDLHQRPEGEHSDSFPTISILVAFLFKILGYDLAIARLLGIFFNVGAVLYFYLFTKRLFKREDLALAGAAIMAMNPLLVFFSHNVQLINPALFFMMGSAYHFLLWKEHNKHNQLFLTAMFFSLSVLTKYTFILIAAPILFIFPWKRIKPLFGRSHRKTLLLALLTLLPVPLWFVYSNFYVPHALGEAGGGAVFGGIIDLSKVFQGAFWDVMKSYARDNYTMLGLFFSVLGFLCVLLFWKKEKEGNLFLVGYVVGALLWIVVMGEKLNGHSYHQYPLVPLFSILIAYALIVIARNVGGIIKLRYSGLAILLGLLLWLSFPSAVARDRQFDTIFPGLDIAGEYINAHSGREEKVWHSSHQNYGVLWHADRKGYKLPSTLEELNAGEERGASWMFIYQWRFDIFEQPVWKEIEQRYTLRQMAFLQRGEGNIQPIFFLLQRGGSFNVTQLNTMVQGKQLYTRTYETSQGELQIGYLNFDAP